MRVVLGVVPDLLDPQAVVGRVAVHLGREGANGLSGALAVLVEGTGLRSAVLRRPGEGDLLAVAGEVVQAVPLRGPRDRPAVVELPVRGPHGPQLATLTVTGAHPSVLPVLRAAGAVLSLVLAAQEPPVPTAAALLADAEAERTALADALHDGPMQELVAARYAADAALHTGDAAEVREAVQRALVALRRTLWQLRPRGADGLAAALHGLSARLVESGGQSLHLRIGPDVDVLAPAGAVAVYRLVQSVTAVPDGGPTTVGVRRQGAPGGREIVVLTVDGGAPLRDAARWRRTAAALDGDLLSCPGRLRLALPVPARPAPTPRAPLGSMPTANASTTKAVL